MPLGSTTKQYETPNHPFQGERIAGEHGLLDRYGLKNKEELWKAQSELRDLRREARDLLGQAGGDAAAAAQQGDEFVAKLVRYGILDEEDSIDDVLSLEASDILERRLQTIVYRKGLANTPQQARQFISHGHIRVDGRRVRVPSFTVPVDVEDEIHFAESSPLADELHPERAEEQ